MYNFDALMFRLKYVPRWSLMRCREKENVAEHSFYTAILANSLGMISKYVFGKSTRPEALVMCALYHDAGEILTGDMPTPVKYLDREITGAYKNVEAKAADSLSRQALPRAADILKEYITGEILSPEEKKLLKAADKLAALIKCIEETGRGNPEFSRAERSTRKAIEEMGSEEADYFIENMLPGFGLCLDRLCRI